MNGDKTFDANQWLKKITPDQNLSDIEQIDDTRVSGFKQWFMSRLIGPFIKLGYYDADADRIVQGSPSESYTWESEFTTASAAALTLTCPAGYRYEVYHACAWNVTQASSTTLTATIGGNTLTLITTAAGQTQIKGLAIGQGFGALSDYSHTAPIGLSAGDTMTLTCGTYAAGNDTQHQYVFKSYRVV